MSKIQTIRNNIDNYYKQQEIERNKEKANRRNSRWNKYYSNKYWHELRKWKITKDPLCEMHLKYGYNVPATSIHHLKPFSTGITEEAKFNLLLNPNNLCSCCESCHDEFHRQLTLQNKDYIKEIIPVDCQYL